MHIKRTEEKRHRWTNEIKGIRLRAERGEGRELGMKCEGGEKPHGSPVLLKKRQAIGCLEKKEKGDYWRACGREKAQQEERVGGELAPEWEKKKTGFFPPENWGKKKRGKKKEKSPLATREEKVNPALGPDKECLSMEKGSFSTSTGKEGADQRVTRETQLLTQQQLWGTKREREFPAEEERCRVSLSLPGEEKETFLSLGGRMLRSLAGRGEREHIREGGGHP